MAKEATKTYNSWDEVWEASFTSDEKSEIKASITDLFSGEYVDDNDILDMVTSYYELEDTLEVPDIVDEVPAHTRANFLWALDI